MADFSNSSSNKFLVYGHLNEFPRTAYFSWIYRFSISDCHPIRTTMPKA